MKGIVFSSLGTMIETRYGLAAWNDAVSHVNSEVDGAYVSADTYSAEELKSLINALSSQLGITPEALLEKFGQKLFGDLYSLYPEMVDSYRELIPFLASVNETIHTEMKILHVDAEVPTLAHKLHDRNKIILSYDSPRRMCILAEGLVRGAAAHFHTEVSLRHDQCMLSGADTCELQIEIQH